MKRYWLPGILLLFGTVAAVTWFLQEEMLQEQVADHQIKVIAHRGGAMDAPENTLAAIEHAVKSGADMVEIDLRMTKDGVLVALHDETLLRTTGVDRAVCEMNSWELQQLDAGTWFSPDFAGEKIPTLGELLKAARGQILLMLELKNVPSEEEFVERTIREIRDMDMEQECVLASTSLEILQKANKLAPELENIYIGEGADKSLWELPYVDGYSICISGLSGSDVEQAHGVGRKLYVWTVNDPWSIAKALEMRVDGLVTDAPEIAIKYPDGKRDR